MEFEHDFEENQKHGDIICIFYSIFNDTEFAIRLLNTINETRLLKALGHSQAHKKRAQTINSLVSIVDATDAYHRFLLSSLNLQIISDSDPDFLYDLWMNVKHFDRLI